MTDHGDPVAPLVDAQDDWPALAQVRDQRGVGAIGIGSPNERQVALEGARGSGELDFVSAGPPVRVRYLRNGGLVSELAQGDESVFEGKGTTGPVVWLLVQSHAFLEYGKRPADCILVVSPSVDTWAGCAGTTHRRRCGHVKSRYGAGPLEPSRRGRL